VDHLHEECPEIGVLVLCGTDPCPHTSPAARQGAKGFVTPATGVDLLAGALHVVGAGGSCFPVSTLLEEHTATDGAALAPSTGPKLTRQQQKVLALLCEGKSNRGIADALELAEGTVKVHVSQILKRFKVSSRTQAALAASGLVDWDQDNPA
jgi:DNA-binding NarL/FixJ family response regulator